MIEKLKNLYHSALGIGVWLLMMFLLVIGVMGLARFTEYFIEWFQVLNNIITSVLVLLLLVSFIPRARQFTGNWIVVCSYIFGAVLWLLCLTITYGFWGTVGVFIGAILLGIGIFATAFIALLLHGEISSAGLILLSLAIIYGIRMLGYWIASKYRSRIKTTDEDETGKLHLTDEAGT